MRLILSTLLLGLMARSSKSDKDDSYYIAGTGNPNKDEKMYWKDAENVFQDLSAFDALYVQYHNCAWSWMQTADEDNDIDENDYWYLGKIPPMGANVAYSLYGSLYGEEFSGCNSETFINSFYTNTGFTNFARAMSYAGLSGFSSYTSDGSSSSSYSSSGSVTNAKCKGGYGVGCDHDNGFAVHTYSGDECNPSNYTGVKDKMQNLNQAMKKAQCIKIYDRNSWGGSPYGTATELLAYSHSCFYQDFFSPDGVCPDPYGKLSYYQNNFYKGIQESKKQDPYQVYQREQEYEDMTMKGQYMSLGGLVLAALATIFMIYDCVNMCRNGKKQPQILALPPIPQQKDDFIVTKRSKDEDDKDQETGSYVTMTHDSDIEAPAYSPPQQVSSTDRSEQQEAPEVIFAPAVAGNLSSQEKVPKKEKEGLLEEIEHLRAELEATKETYHLDQVCMSLSDVAMESPPVAPVEEPEKPVELAPLETPKTPEAAEEPQESEETESPTVPPEPEEPTLVPATEETDILIAPTDEEGTELTAVPSMDASVHKVKSSDETTELEASPSTEVMSSDEPAELEASPSTESVQADDDDKVPPSDDDAEPEAPAEADMESTINDASQSAEDFPDVEEQKLVGGSKDDGDELTDAILRSRDEYSDDEAEAPVEDKAQDEKETVQEEAMPSMAEDNFIEKATDLIEQARVETVDDDSSEDGRDITPAPASEQGTISPPSMEEIPAVTSDEQPEIEQSQSQSSAKSWFGF